MCGARNTVRLLGLVILLPLGVVSLAGRKEKNMKKLSFFSTAARGVKTHLRGLRLLAIGLMGLTMLSPTLPAQTGSVYRVTMTNPGTMGMTTLGCTPEGYVLATWDQGFLKGIGSAQGAPNLLLNLITTVAWTRKYGAGRGTAGTFDGCYGETFADPATGNLGFHGGLFFDFYRAEGSVPSTISIGRHFDYYVTAGNETREHFTMGTGKIPFPEWTGGDISGRVKGNFNFSYYLKEGGRLINLYTPLPGGQELDFEFDLAIEKVELYDPVDRAAPIRPGSGRGEVRALPPRD